MFRKKKFETGVVVHDAGSVSFVELVVHGVHRDGVADQLTAEVKAAVQTHRPWVLILNLLDFKYRFGNDIAGAILVGFVALRELRPPGVYRLVAQERETEALELSDPGARG